MRYGPLGNEMHRQVDFTFDICFSYVKCKESYALGIGIVNTIFYYRADSPLPILESAPAVQPHRTATSSLSPVIGIFSLPQEFFASKDMH